MAGTKTGGLTAAETNRRLYGEDYYSQLGKKGGKAPYKGLKGFAANKELARTAGAKGGRISRRNKPQSGADA